MSEVEYRDLNDLKVWDRNYRMGDVNAIVRSITQFGFNQALRVWRDGIVVAGNHSLKALQQLKASGWSPRGGGLTADWQVRIIDVSHLTKTEAEAFAIADNRTSELATNDDEQLATLLREIESESDALLSATGYESGDVDAMLEAISSVTPPDEFEQYDENIDTEYCCPKCGYEWSGSPR